MKVDIKRDQFGKPTTITLISETLEDKDALWWIRPDTSSTSNGAIPFSYGDEEYPTLTLAVVGM